MNDQVRQQYLAPSDLFSLWLGGIACAVFALAAFFAPFIAPHDPLEQDLISSLLPPVGMPDHDPTFLLGTDSLGRDLLSRLIYGARIALTVALLAAGFAALLGTTLGLLAGYFGGWIDAVISRIVDIWMSFPAVLLSIVLVAVMGTGLHSVVIAIGIIDWTRFCRVIRAETLVQKNRDYVFSAKALGLRPTAILLREVLPNVFPVLCTLFFLEMGIAVVVEAILSFVGLSLSSDTPTWGGLIEEGRQYIHEAWWVMLAPTLCIIVLVLALNTFGESLRKLLDPVMRQ